MGAQTSSGPSMVVDRAAFSVNAFSRIYGASEELPLQKLVGAQARSSLLKFQRWLSQNVLKSQKSQESPTVSIWGEILKYQKTLLVPAESEI